MAKRLSLKPGSLAKRAVAKTEKDLAGRSGVHNKYALARHITKKAGRTGRARLARRGLSR